MGSEQYPAFATEQDKDAFLSTVQSFGSGVTKARLIRALGWSEYRLELVRDTLKAAGAIVIQQGKVTLSGEAAVSQDEGELMDEAPAEAEVAVEVAAPETEPETEQVQEPVQTPAVRLPNTKPLAKPAPKVEHVAPPVNWSLVTEGDFDLELLRHASPQADLDISGIEGLVFPIRINGRVAVTADSLQWTISTLANKEKGGWAAQHFVTNKAALYRCLRESKYPVTPEAVEALAKLPDTFREFAETVNVRSRRGRKATKDG